MSLATKPEMRHCDSQSGREVGGQEARVTKVRLPGETYCFRLIPPRTMRLKAKVGPKGQVVIPKEVRDILGISPGDEVVFELGDREAKIKPAGRSSSVSELTEIVPKKDKLSKDVDVKKLILSETMVR